MASINIQSGGGINIPAERKDGQEGKERNDGASGHRTEEEEAV